MPRSGSPFLMAMLLGTALLLMGNDRAEADTGYCAKWESWQGTCVKWIDTGGESESPGGLDEGGGEVGGSGGGEGASPRVCSYQGRVVQCETALGVWSTYADSWCRPVVPQPPLSDPAWDGASSGAVYSCSRAGFDGLPDPWSAILRWLPTAPEAPDPEELARRLLASIDFQAPEVAVFPPADSLKQMTYVGWNTWFWAEPSSVLQWGPVTDSISEAGVTVSLTARVTGLTWEMGDGESVSCGKGTAWTMSATSGRNVASPDCGYVYSEDGRYTVRVVSDWAVDWSGGGRSGSLPFTLSRDREVIVGEMQSVSR